MKKLTGYRNLNEAVSSMVYYLVMIVYLFTIIYPIYLMTVTSLKPTAEIFQNPYGLPNTLYLGNYIQLLVKVNCGTYFLNSITVVVVSLAVIILVSAPAAYVFARVSSRTTRIIYIVFLAGLVIPIRLGTISLLKMFVAMGLNDHLASLIVINATVGIPLGIFILTDFMRMIPKEIYEAAHLDGCSDQGIFVWIVLPLIKPAVSVLAIIMFIPIWNDFWFPLILIKSDSMKTIPLAIALLFGQYRTNFGLVFAALTISSLPIVAFYLVVSRFFTKDLFRGMIK